MFAVRGWNVPAEKLRAETASAAVPNGDAASKSKKRKRSNPNEVTAANVVEMWERVIEHKEKGGSEKKLSRSERKRQKRELAAKAAEDGGAQQAAPEPKPTAPASSGPPLVQETEAKKEKKEKKERKEKKKKKDKQRRTEDVQPDLHASTGASAEAAPKKTKPASAALPPPPPPPAAKLTPLQASMREKLVSARFRHLNETLYTRPSAEAYQLFLDSPDMFAEYHEGFRRQVAVWPENPVDSYVRELLRRGRIRDDRRRHHRPPPQQPPGQEAPLLPLPRTAGTCTVADVGCGDARLAEALAPAAAKLRVDVRSFDLHSPSPRVVRADAAALPLADGAVDVVLFCLALMGTNWLDFVEEAYRVLRWKGELWVAEIQSRFGPPSAGKHRPLKKVPVEHSVGNRRKKAAKAKDGAAADDGAPTEADVADLAVEVDGAEDRRRETDVSAFVAALARRGFVLQGDAGDAVDLSNRMFVRMRFLKAAPPVKGKGVATVKAAGHEISKKRKFLDPADGEDEDAAEAGILKPCVYKLR